MILACLLRAMRLRIFLDFDPPIESVLLPPIATAIEIAIFDTSSEKISLSKILGEPKWILGRYE